MRGALSQRLDVTCDLRIGDVLGLRRAPYGTPGPSVRPSVRGALQRIGNHDVATATAASPTTVSTSTFLWRSPVFSSYFIHHQNVIVLGRHHVHQLLANKAVRGREATLKERGPVDAVILRAGKHELVCEQPIRGLAVLGQVALEHGSDSIDVGHKRLLSPTYPVADVTPGRCEVGSSLRLVWLRELIGHPWFRGRDPPLSGPVAALVGLPPRQTAEHGTAGWEVGSLQAGVAPDLATACGSHAPDLEDDRLLSDGL
jgi:hypothetical protein